MGKTDSVAFVRNPKGRRPRAAAERVFGGETRVGRGPGASASGRVPVGSITLAVSDIPGT